MNIVAPKDVNDNGGKFTTVAFPEIYTYRGDTDDQFATVLNENIRKGADRKIM